MTDEKGKTTTITGIVAASNDRGKGGVKLQGEDEWRNVSKFSDGVVIPAKGTSVILTLDSSGYIRSIGPAPKDTAQPEDSQPRQEGATAAKTDWARKDALMVRMSCLRGACEIVAAATPGMAGMRTEDLAAATKSVAADFERWVNRKGDAPDITVIRDVPDWADVEEQPTARPQGPVPPPMKQDNRPDPPAQLERAKPGTIDHWGKLSYKAKQLGIDVEPIALSAPEDEFVRRGNDLSAQVKAALAARGG